jgi:hypothetical protein
LFYKDLAEQGKVYEEIAKKAGIILTDDNRTDFKQSFFEEIFFSKVSERKTKIKRAFVDLFPSASKTIEEIKGDDYTKFPIKLQKMEAWIMIDVLKQLLAEGITAMSIHDSIVVNNAEDIKIAEKLIA